MVLIIVDDMNHNRVSFERWGDAILNLRALVATQVKGNATYMTIILLVYVSEMAVMHNSPK